MSKLRFSWMIQTICSILSMPVFFACASDAWAALGLAQLRQNRLAEAESSLKRALELDGESVRAQTYMARLLRRTGRQKEADALGKALKEDLYNEDFAAVAPMIAGAAKAAELPPAATAQAGVFPSQPEPRPRRRGLGRWLAGTAVLAAIVGTMLGVIVALTARSPEWTLAGVLLAGVSGVILFLLAAVLLARPQR